MVLLDLFLITLSSSTADIYLSQRRETGKLYSESYESVAVMFASIPNYLDFYSEAEIHQGGVTCLKILNEIIAAFDKLLFEAQFNRVEKIKVISSTYMAACGLQPGRKGSTDNSSEQFSGGSNVRTMARLVDLSKSDLFLT